MHILIDTNILIPLEPSSHLDVSINTESAILLHNLSNSSKNPLCVHNAIQHDLNRDRDINRAEIRRKLINRYKLIPNPPDVSVLDESIVGTPIFASNDYVDNCYLASVKANAVDFLVSEDLGVHKKARRLGIGSRVLFLVDAINLLQDFFDSFPSVPPSVHKVYLHEVDDRDEIFDSLRVDYGSDFERWMNKCKREHREAFIVKDQDKLAGILIFKQEECLPSGEKGKTLKLCTFKISASNRGNRYGELLLKTIFDYSDQNKYKYVYFTVFQKHGRLIEFAESFGFNASNIKSRIGEEIVIKTLNHSLSEIQSMSALEAHIQFGPRQIFFHNNKTFIVPIKPEFHQLLFPELEPQIPLININPTKPCGNSIKKAYICHSNTNKLKPGDNILFYRSQDISGIDAVGIVEETIRSTSPNIVAQYVGTRTVYKYQEIEEICKKPTLVILFRYAKGVPPILLHELIKHNILKGQPQSISQLSPEGVRWIQEKITT